MGKTLTTGDEEAAIPLIEAVPIQADGDISAKHDDGDDGDKGTTTRRIFKVVAPADLPKGYRLTVVTAKNEEVVVLVPPGGVQTWQTFEGREASPITKRWADSEFDCAPDYEGSFCCLAFCFPVLGWAFILKKLGMNAFGIRPAVETENSRKWANMTPWVVGAILLFSAYLQPFSLVYFLFLATFARSAVRAKYNIPGSLASDCLCATCCGCCTLLQSYRHMKRNGDTPCQCERNMVEATQV